MSTLPPITPNTPNNLSSSILSANKSKKRSRTKQSSITKTDPRTLLTELWRRPQAFKVLKDRTRQLLFQLKSNQSTTNLDTDCLLILLEALSSNDNFNDIFQERGFLELFVQLLHALKNLDNNNNSPKAQYIRTCCIYCIICHTTPNTITDTIEELLLTGSILYLNNMCLPNALGTKDNQTTQTATLSKFCYLAKNKSTRNIRDLTHIATLSLFDIFQYAATLPTQFERFQLIDRTGVFETVLRSTFHTSENISHLLQRYSGEDIVRFKHNGLWRAPPGKLVQTRLNEAIGRHKTHLERQAQQLKIIKATQEIFKTKTPQSLHPRLKATKLVTTVELFGIDAVPLVSTPRNVITPCIRPEQILYQSWQTYAEMNMASKLTILKKAKLYQTLAKAENYKSNAAKFVSRDHAALRQQNNKSKNSNNNDANDNVAKINPEDEINPEEIHHSSTIRILTIANAEYAVGEAVVLAGKHGLDSSNTIEVIALENAEHIARKIVQLEEARQDALEIDVLCLLKPIKQRKKVIVDDIDIRVRSLRREKAHLEREQRTKRAANNAAAAAAAVAAVAAAQNAKEEQDTATTTTMTTPASEEVTSPTEEESPSKRRSRRGRGRNKMQKETLTPAEIAQRAALLRLQQELTALEEEARIIHTSKLIEVFDSDERLAHQFLTHALSTVKCNVECAKAALEVAVQKLSIERIIHDMNEHKADVQNSLHNWDRMLEGLRQLQAAKVEEAVALCALTIKCSRMKKEKLAWSSKSSAEPATSTSTSSTSTSSSSSSSSRLALAATQADAAALQVSLHVISSRLTFLHPRVLGLREAYVSSILHPAIELGSIYCSLALARTELDSLPEHLEKTTAKYKHFVRRVDFYRWRCANNETHIANNVHGYHLIQKALHDDHATPIHLLHKAGASAVNVLETYEGEEMQAEIAFASANEIVLAAEITEGLIGSNVVSRHLLSMHGDGEDEDHSEWRAFCESNDTLFGPSVISRGIKIMEKVQDFARSAHNCVTLAKEQVKKVINMIHEVHGTGSLTPLMRTAIQREETIFGATRKKLHHANFMLSENYSMLASTFDSERARNVAENKTIEISIRNEAKAALNHAANHLIVANKIMGSTTGTLTEGEMKAMRAEMEKLREKRIKEENKKNKIQKDEANKKLMQEEKERHDAFVKEKKEKKKAKMMAELRMKEAELQKIKQIKKDKKNKDIEARQKRKADLKKQEKILASKKQEWQLEKIEMKKMKRAELECIKIDAKECSKYFIKYLLDAMDPLIEIAEENARQKRKEKVIHGKKMLKEAKNWEEEDDGSWLNWRTNVKQWEVPDCVQTMWEVTGDPRGAPAPAASEWEALYDEEGYTYYYNASTGVSSYDAPVAYGQEETMYGQEETTYGQEEYAYDY